MIRARTAAPNAVQSSDRRPHRLVIDPLPKVMSMDFEEDFRKTVRDTVAALIKRAKSTQTWDVDGRSVTGWTVGRDSYGPTIKGNPGSGGYWEETWGNSCTVLDVDGNFWDYSFSGRETSAHPEAVLSYGLAQSPNHKLVGHTGKPFAAMKARLERLPYL
jgi:hypothetical protein